MIYLLIWVGILLFSQVLVLVFVFNVGNDIFKFGQKQLYFSKYELEIVLT